MTTAEPGLDNASRGEGGAQLTMSKIRINELARELEVKPIRILDLLPELGVADKKTHSSSLDDDVADQVRRHFGVEVVRPALPEEAAPAPGAAIPAVSQAAPVPAAGRVAEAPAEVAARGVAPAAKPAEPAAPVGEFPAVRPSMQPLRPPLAVAGRPAPVVPPVAVEAAAAAAPAVPIPVKPLPAPKPGQILSGPRRPFPATGAELAPGPPAAPPPRAPMPGPRMAAPQRAAAASATGAGPARRETAARSGALVGQPTARPVVPPRPDMVQKLAQSKAAPAQPAVPRPGMPQQRPATPTPGQPIYRGSIRPGQPLMQRAGGPAGAAGARPIRGRPMHPTSPVAPGGPVPVTTDRRDAGKRRAATQRQREAEQEERTLFGPRKNRQSEALLAVNKDITIAEGITVKELSEKLGIKANLVIKKLVERKVFATINQNLDVKLAEELARLFGATTSQLSYEQESSLGIEMAEEAKDQLKRAPVVTIMGHVDHGKTSLLDAIRETHVADHEAGGITQHIGAYHVEKNGRKIVFIDTPGHEAFTRMRARGAKVTDIVVLVVAADDGVMPQTKEAIDHARAAKVPIVVAINKIDIPGAQIERIKQQLADQNLLPEEWGGDTVTVPVSARAKTNLDLLLDMILLVAEMQDLKANPARPAIGSVLEAELDRGRGPVATVLVRNGTLRVGDYFICGSVFGKVRAMFDDRGNPLREAEPSMPVEVIGLEFLPEVGDTFQVVTDTAKAKQIVIYRERKIREEALRKAPKISLDQLHMQLREGEIKELNVILKADVGGTSEVLSDTLQKLSNEKVRIRVLHSGVGAITETDVLLATASNAIVVGFNVRPERNAQLVAEQEKVDLRLHTIIYELTDEIKRAMSGMLDPVFKEAYRGRAGVREVFRITKVGMVAGCLVQDGVLTRECQVRLLRDNVVVHTGRIDSLRRFKNDVSEVKSGFECGVGLANYGDIKPGDVIEAFVTERVAQEVLA
jgi:translation initiation factor IF-2